MSRRSHIGVDNSRTFFEFDDNGNPKRLRIDTILSMLKFDSFENAQQIAAEALEKAANFDDCNRSNALAFACEDVVSRERADGPRE